MFGWDQKDRLLRESWTADDLAQELYAMFGPEVPNNTEAPVKVTLPVGATVAPIQIGNMTDGGQVLNFRRADGSNAGTVGFDPTSGLNFTPPGANATPQSLGGGGGSVVPVWG